VAKIKNLLDFATAGQRIAQRYPTSKKSIENPYDPSLVINQDAMRASPEGYKKNVGLLADQNYVKTKARSLEGKAQAAMDADADNLLWLYNNAPEEIRNVSRNWYLGANRTSQELAKKHNISNESSAGVIAALSPQMDWNKNVSLANRVISIYNRSQGKPLEKDAFKALREIYEKPGSPHNSDIKVIESGVPFEELTKNQKAMYVRAIDKTFNSTNYNLSNPTGDIVGLALNKDGAPSKISWGSNTEIGKAISVLDDPSVENISRSMGDAHKVRNFYNNIVNPNYAYQNPFVGDITIDTHAVAAASMKPFSGQSAEVAANFGSGGGAANTSISGAKGTYGMRADAARLAAQEAGIMPREMQSVTWDVARTMFPRTFKTKENVQAINAIWDMFKKGKISANDARSAIVERAGGFGKVDWATSKSNTGKNVGGGTSIIGGSALATDALAGNTAGGNGRGNLGIDPAIPQEWFTGDVAAAPTAGLLAQNYQGDLLGGMDFSTVKGDQRPFLPTVGEYGKSMVRGAATGSLDTFNALEDLGRKLGFIPDNSAYIPKEVSDRSRQTIRSKIPDYKAKYATDKEKSLFEMIGSFFGA
jgi:hypothetical protein